MQHGKSKSLPRAGQAQGKGTPLKLLYHEIAEPTAAGQRRGEIPLEKKKRLRDMTWDDYGISRHRYQELKAFCLQYYEKRGKYFEE